MAILQTEFDPSSLSALLVDISSLPCVSLYVPILPPQPTARANALQQRALLEDARLGLVDVGLGQSAVDRILSPIESLFEDRSFVARPRKAVAAFLNEDFQQVVDLPFDVPAIAVVANHPYLLPLASAFGPERRFHLLVLNHRQAHLYSVDPWSIRKEDALSVSMEDLESERGRQVDLQFRRQGAGPTGTTLFHGHGGRKDVATNELDRFLYEVARAIGSPEFDSKLPLVLAGEPSVTASFRSIVEPSRPVLATMARGVNHSEAELHVAAWQLVHERLDGGLHESLGRYERLAGTGLTCSRPEDIRDAAMAGQVDVLLLPDHDGGPHEADEAGAALNEALIHTLRHAGTIHAGFEGTGQGHPPGAGAILRRPGVA